MRNVANYLRSAMVFRPGKNQNTLEDANIHRIVDAYVNRVDVDKFAHAATMAEIEADG